MVVAVRAVRTRERAGRVAVPTARAKLALGTGVFTGTLTRCTAIPRGNTAGCATTAVAISTGRALVEAASGPPTPRHGGGQTTDPNHDNKEDLALHCFFVFFCSNFVLFFS